MVGLVVENKGSVDLDFYVLSYSQSAQLILPSFHLKKQNRADSGMTETKSSQPRFTTTSPTLYKLTQRIIYSDR